MHPDMHFLTKRNGQHIKKHWFAEVSNLQEENENKGLRILQGFFVYVGFFHAKNALLNDMQIGEVIKDLFKAYVW